MRLELVGCDKHPKQTRDAQSICQYTMNFVDIAVLVRERRESAHISLLPILTPISQPVLGTEKGHGAISAVSTPPVAASEE